MSVLRKSFLSPVNVPKISGVFEKRMRATTTKARVEATVKKLRKKFEAALSERPTQRSVASCARLRFSNHLCFEEEMIAQLGDLAILLYRIGKTEIYGRIIDARNLLMSEVDVRPN
jgi:hypothetical protein